MNFEDMQKVWNQEQDTFQYVINEQKLTDQIRVKKDKVGRFANKLEIKLMLITGIVGIILIATAFKDANTFQLLPIVGIVMLAGSGYIAYLRKQRKRSIPKVTKSIKEHLDLAILNAGYIEKVSKSMLILGVPLLVGFWLNSYFEGKSMEALVGIALFVVIILIASRWEHRQIHMKRKSDLIKLKERLISD